MEKSHPFVTQLLALADDRAALATLRRSLITLDVRSYQYIVPRLHWAGVQPWETDNCYLIAGLFALHPVCASSGNLGDHWRATIANKDQAAATERRFTQLLATSVANLAFPLRQSVLYLRSKDVAINWHQLLYDLNNWSHPDGFVQRQWATAFWSSPQSEPPAQNHTDHT